MKKLLFVWILGHVSAMAFGQTDKIITLPTASGANGGLICSNDQYGSRGGDEKISYEEALVEYSNIQGSPFLHGGELTVDLILYNDSIVSEVPIRYDLFNKELVAKNEKGENIVLNQLYYNGFVYENNGATEVYKKAPTSEFKFFEVLFQNEDFSFCKETVVTLWEDGTYVPGLDAKRKKFLSKQVHCIVVGEDVHPVRLKNEDVLDHLPGAYKERAAALKEQLKIKKFKNESDWQRMMKEL